MAILRRYPPCSSAWTERFIEDAPGRVTAIESCAFAMVRTCSRTLCPAWTVFGTKWAASVSFAGVTAVGVAAGAAVAVSEAVGVAIGVAAGVVAVDVATGTVAVGPDPVMMMRPCML